MNAMASVAVRFSRNARRAMPFMIRQKARLVPEPVSILGPTGNDSAQGGPWFDVLLEAEEMAAWARLTLNAAAIRLVLEGSLGASVLGSSSLDRELTLAQRALVSRVARGLAESFAESVRDQVGLTFAAVSSQARSDGESSELATARGLCVGCAFEPSLGGAQISIAVSAEALELAAREQEDEPGAAPDPRMAEALLDVELELVAELGKVRLGLRDVLGLHVGQVLRLPTATDDPIVVRVAQSPKLHGRPVVSRGQVSVEIRGRVDE